MKSEMKEKHEIVNEITAEVKEIFSFWYQFEHAQNGGEFDNV